MKNASLGVAQQSVNNELLATYILLTIGLFVSSLGALEATPCTGRVSVFRADVCMDFALGITLVVLGLLMCYLVGRDNSVVLSHWGEIASRSCLYICVITATYLCLSITTSEILNTMDGYIVVASERTVVGWLAKVVLGVAALDWACTLFTGVRLALGNKPYTGTYLQRF